VGRAGIVARDVCGDRVRRVSENVIGRQAERIGE
jgi:hypothetical protein